MAVYTPTKYYFLNLLINQGLADTLRSEMLLYDITVQIFLPNTMLTTGYDRENITKPDITKAIEDGDTPVSPEAAAKAMLAGSLMFFHPEELLRMHTPQV